MKRVCKLALEMSKDDCPSKIVFVWGESGSGKSSFIVHAIDKARRALLTNRKRIVITRNISSEGDWLVPFRYDILFKFACHILACFLTFFLQLVSFNF